MKKFKKISATVAATLMAATMVAPVAFNTFAESKTTIAVTIPADISIKDNKVTACKIFNLKIDDSGQHVQDWAISEPEIIAALKVAVNASETATAADVANIITENSDLAIAFARAASNNLTSGGVDGTLVSNKVTFSGGLEDGYYVFECIGVKNVLDENLESPSLGMLLVVNNKASELNLSTIKVGLPTVEKKVLEDDKEASEVAKYEQDNKKWNDVADLEIGQKATFGLYGTLPENYARYDNYSYEFVDHLGATFIEPSNFAVTASNATLTETTEEVAGDYTVTVTPVTDGGYDISIKFANLKSNAKVDENTVITVKYDTALNENAVPLKANLNEVSLKYSNNPNKSGTGEYDTDNNKGKTPEDKVGVYTYDFKFEKTFWNNGSDLTVQEIKNGDYDKLKFAITGKKFKKVTAGDADYGTYDYVVVKNDAEDATDELELTLIDDKGKIVDKTVEGWEDSVNKNYHLVVRVKGLDSDEYKITEDNNNWPEYKKLAETEGAFELKSNLELKQDEKIFADLKDQSTYEKTSAGYYEVKNTKGITLPSTGGIGTTLFYLGGGAMVAIAGVFLITKKRMGKEEA